MNYYPNPSVYYQNQVYPAGVPQINPIQYVSPPAAQSFFPCVFCHTTVPAASMASHLQMCQSAQSAASAMSMASNPFGSTQSVQYRRTVRVERKTLDEKNINPGLKMKEYQVPTNSIHRERRVDQGRANYMNDDSYAKSFQPKQAFAPQPTLPSPSMNSIQSNQQYTTATEGLYASPPTQVIRARAPPPPPRVSPTNKSSQPPQPSQSYRAQQSPSLQSQGSQPPFLQNTQTRQPFQREVRKVETTIPTPFSERIQAFESKLPKSIRSPPPSQPVRSQPPSQPTRPPPPSQPSSQPPPPSQPTRSPPSQPSSQPPPPSQPTRSPPSQPVRSQPPPPSQPVRSPPSQPVRSQPPPPSQPIRSQPPPAPQPTRPPPPSQPTRPPPPSQPIRPPPSQPVRSQPPSQPQLPPQSAKPQPVQPQKQFSTPHKLAMPQSVAGQLSLEEMLLRKQQNIGGVAERAQASEAIEEAALSRNNDAPIITLAEEDMGPSKPPSDPPTYSSTNVYTIQHKKEDMLIVFAGDASIPFRGYSSMLSVYPSQACIYSYDNVSNSYCLQKSMHSTECVFTRMDKYISSLNSIRFGILIMETSKE